LAEAEQNQASASGKTASDKLGREERLHPGDSVGEFEIVEVLGIGGFGAVYKAHQERWGRDAAVKTVLPSMTAHVEDIAQRFLREIDLVRRLEHPNIVRLYETDDGLLWMAMELVSGPTLTQLLKAEKRLSARRARQITMQMLSGLVEAHDKSIVHRDLKPANIMLTRKGAQRDWVKILDFGIGKALSGGGRVEQNLTATGSGGYGTPRYMAPEQIRNKEIGPHTDVYAAGLMLYEMLIGRPAVGGETTYEILAAQITDPVEVPDWLRNTPLGNVLTGAIEKNWESRYQTALDFYESLEALDPATLLGSMDAEVPVPSNISAVVGTEPTASGPQSGPPSNTPSRPQPSGGSHSTSKPVDAPSQPTPSGPPDDIHAQATIATPPPNRIGVKAIVLGVVILLAIVAGVVAFVMLSGDQDTGTDDAEASASTGENRAADDGLASTETPDDPAAGEDDAKAAGGEADIADDRAGGAAGGTSEDGAEAKETEAVSDGEHAATDDADGESTPTGDTPGSDEASSANEAGDGTDEPDGEGEESAASKGENGDVDDENDGDEVEENDEEREARVRKCKVKARSKPVSAAVYLDGRKVCSKTPCSFEVNRDRRRIELEFKAPGFYDREVKVSVRRRSVSAEATLVRAL